MVCAEAAVELEQAKRRWDSVASLRIPDSAVPLLHSACFALEGW
jgi:hypothetical protein